MARRIDSFFGPYLRRYASWGLLAILVVPIYGIASAGMVALIEPIFGEVLLAGSTPEDSFAVLPSEGEESATGRSWGVPSILNLKRWTDETYLGLKRRFGITKDNVYIFTPLLLLAVFLVRGLTGFLSGYAFQRIGLGVTNDIRNDVYRRLLDQSSRFHDRHTSGELVSRVINDVSQLHIVVSARLYDAIPQAVALLFLLGLLLSTHLQLALVCLLGAPPVLWVIRRFGKAMRAASHRSQEYMGEVASLLSEGVRGHRVVKAFGMEEFENRRFQTATGRHLGINLHAQMLAALSSPVIEAIVAFGISGFLFYAAVRIRAGSLSAPLLLQFMANLLLMYDPIRRLNKMNLLLQQALAAAQRLRALLEIPLDIQDAPGARVLEPMREQVRFEGVAFAYDREPVLRGIDLCVRKGERVAVVGPSGAGKSTLVGLLPRFFDPSSGRVEIDGHDLRQVALAGLRGQIGIVTQETVLFNDTVRNNIAYGVTDAPIEKVREAARGAFAEEFILRMRDGYDTTIGEWGMQLSGGQRQRLAIARAFFKNAPILILDEATSQLDSESESLVQKALDNLMRGRTTLVIAHRISTVVNADRIVVLEDGLVVEQGSHAELLALGGSYKRLVDLQFMQPGDSSRTDAPVE